MMSSKTKEHKCKKLNIENKSSESKPVSIIGDFIDDGWIWELVAYEFGTYINFCPYCGKELTPKK